MANRYEELIGSDDKPRDELGYLYIQFTIHTLHALMEDGVLVGDQLVMNYSPTEKNSMSDVSGIDIFVYLSGNNEPVPLQVKGNARAATRERKKGRGIPVCNLRTDGGNLKPESQYKQEVEYALEQAIEHRSNGNRWVFEE